MKILDAIQQQIEAEYGRPLAKIEAAVKRTGCEVAEFRLLQSGDFYLDYGELTCEQWKTDGPGCIPQRLILRPKPKRRILLTETGEVRQAEPGEWASGSDEISGCMCDSTPQRLLDGSYGRPFSIWTARELKPGETV